MDWLDLEPLRRECGRIQADAHGELDGEHVSTLSLLLWRIAHALPRKDLKFSIAVDVPAALGRERTLGIAAIRPAAFFNNDCPEKGFASFNRELNRRVTQTRLRCSETFELVDSISLLPASLYLTALRVLGKGIRECLGTTGISVLRSAPLLVPAQSDVHVNGFIGYGRYDLPTEDGGRAGVIAVKGPPQDAADLLSAICAALNQGFCCASDASPDQI